MKYKFIFPQKSFWVYLFFKMKVETIKNKTSL